MSDHDQNDPKNWPGLLWRIWKTVWPPNAHALWSVIVVLMTIAGFVGAWLGKPAPSIPPSPLDERPPAHEVIGSQGWVSDPEEVATVVAGLAIKTFGATSAAAVEEGELPAHVYLWQAYQQIGLLGPPVKNQLSVGCCVSFGTNTAIEGTMANAIAAGKPETWKRICEEATYGGSRVEIGGGRIRGDGSVGAWAAKFVKEYGIISRQKHGQYDLSEYSESRAREWGRRGVPNELEPLAREHPVGEITQVTNWAEAKRALASGYGIAVSSDQGFSMTRDSRGVARAQGNWAHCMSLNGYHRETDGSEFGHIENSWGPDAHRGPVGWGNPPPSGFWADAKVIDRMLKQGDSWTFSDVKGFPRKRIDWPASVQPKRRPGELFAVFDLAR